MQVLHWWNIARHDGAPRLARSGLFFNPFQIEQMACHLVIVFVAACEINNEMLLGVAAFVNNDAAQLPLFFADIVHLGAHQVAHFLDRFCGEAYGHQFVRQGPLRLGIQRCAIALRVVHPVDFFKQVAQRVKAAQGFAFELFELFGQGLGATFAVVVVSRVEFVKVFFGYIVVGLVGV